MKQNLSLPMPELILHRLIKKLIASDLWEGRNHPKLVNKHRVSGVSLNAHIKSSTVVADKQ